MGKVIINIKAAIEPSAALKHVGDIMSQLREENSTYAKFIEINAGKYTYTISYKKGSGSDIFTIELTEIRNEVF